VSGILQRHIPRFDSVQFMGGRGACLSYKANVLASSSVGFPTLTRAFTVVEVLLSEVMINHPSHASFNLAGSCAVMDIR
jgi:hypothetical protein